MNWVAVWHLWCVLLVLNGVRASEEESISRPTSARVPKPKRPLRSNNIGNSIKTGPEGDYKSPPFADEPVSTTSSAFGRLTSKRINNVDNLARNTVPVVAATETARKSHRPPPSHLLAYQAVSTTERGGGGKNNEPNLSPTGWALAAGILGPSKNSTSPVPKRNTVTGGTAKPFNSFWSSRLQRPGNRTTPITPVDVKAAIDNVINQTETGIPSENLIRFENNTKHKQDEEHNESGVSDRPASGSISTEHGNVLEEPSVFSDTRKKHLENSTTQSTLFSTNNIPNTGNNLIKGVRGGDLGSSILNGIVLATAASRYGGDTKLSNGVGESERRNSSKVETQITTDMRPSPEPENAKTTQKLQYTTSVDIVPAVTKLPNQQEHASPAFVTRSSSMKSFPTVPVSVGTNENVTTTEEPTSSELSPQTVHERSSLPYSTDALEHLLENFISPTTPLENTTAPSPVARVTTLSSSAPEITTVQPESSTLWISAKTIETTTELSRPTSASHAYGSISTSSPNITSTTESLTTTLSNGLLEPNLGTLSTTKKPYSSYSTTVSATTLPQDLNDIPEAISRIKGNTKIFSGSSQGTDNVLFPTSTSPPVTTTESKMSFDSDSTTEPTQKSTVQLNSSTTVSFSSADKHSNERTTTEAIVNSDQPTMTQSIGESTTMTIFKQTDTFETKTETVGILITTLSPTVQKTESSTEPVTITKNAEESSTASSGITTLTPMLYQPSSSNPFTTTTKPPGPETVQTTIVYSSKGQKNTSQSSTVVVEDIHIGPLDKNESEESQDETLKYNVTVVDPADKPTNATDQESDYNDNDKDEDENDKDVEIPTTTTLIIIEEITTSRAPTSRLTTSVPTSTTVDISRTTTEGSFVDINLITTTVPGSIVDEGVTEPRLRLTFQATFKEMCLAKDGLTESIAGFFKDMTSRPIHPSQVNVLNLGMNECAGKSLPFTDKAPVILYIADSDGKGDQNLTDMLYTYMKQGRFNFKYQLSSVELGSKPLIMEEENQWSGTVIAAIVISSVAGVSLLCLTILLVIMRKRQKGFTYGQRCTPVSLEDYSLDNISVFNSVRRKAMRASKRSYGNPAFDDPVTVTNPLNFVGLSTMANSHAKIDNEYSEVPTVTVKPDELPPGAESKNRYANVIPIPETRVPLNGSEREDVFINANYVKGAKGVEKFYIACQAPLESTIADFWMMVWEQQTQIILMLTDLHENGVEKCADYLPPSEVLDCHRVFGDLQVTLKKREVREKYIISSLQLKNLESNLWREVHHLWYTSWPIRGVPDDLTSIIAYLIEARSYSKPGHPIVVHCSPGTGRTGTVIAIDTAIRDFETDRIVDIPKTVYSIRRDRAGAVQTNLQYYLIYQVIHLYATKLTGGGLDSI